MTAMWTKAKATRRSAHLLFEMGDLNGAVNRAYYAMIQAATVAIAFAAPELRPAKTHNGTMRHFGKYVVLRHGVEPELGRKLAQTEDVRCAADYDDEPVDKDEVIVVLADMDLFLTAMASFIGTDLK